MYPRASKYHIAVDEFRGISAVVARAHAHGEAGGTAFTTSHSRLECAAGDLVVAAVGTNSGTAPACSAEWNALPCSDCRPTVCPAPTASLRRRCRERRPGPPRPSGAR
ncbi:hypothetical protein ACFVYD_12745 [Streptomyces sp. NPDC058301]|uniref:hypothetical protein n=1 Tax=Streptomyces sp. NPDC058301 TaxID=3346436 RepID=UPI0036E50F93